MFAVLLALAGSAFAAEGPPAPGTSSGFYGGISLRAAGQEAEGVSFGHLFTAPTSVWSRFAAPTTDDNGSRTLAYGGYRWANDVAVEAAVAMLDRYALQPTLPGARRGIGLALVPDGDTQSKTWNVDVYTSWEFRKSMSLYGRLGYAQSERAPAYAPVGDVVRPNRDGVNYGLGVRYDMTPALGLRLEYARFGKLPADLANGVMPENDQVQLGLQFRF
ncbi:MAG TPA: outer membrane beta-barrel protein [Casimicrobiaceae bacterium]|nr:outer membrane beta-barrel protein [Casimicrobiaceae bacterium]